jgi:hypothetical protein
MNSIDEQGVMPEDRHPSVWQDDEREHFIARFVKDHPCVSPEQVERVMDQAIEKVAPSEHREQLVAVLEDLLKTTAYPPMIS